MSISKTKTVPANDLDPSVEDFEPTAEAPNWLKRVNVGQSRIYPAILSALETAIEDGELQPGDQLPPQRQVASLLGIDFTTVTRAYAAARERGLVEATVGRGTFVSRRMIDDDYGRILLGLNGPPQPHGVSIGKLLREGMREIVDRTDLNRLLAYHQGAGSLRERAAGASWTAPTLGDVNPNRVLVTGGAQLALTGLLTSLFRPGDVLVVEPFTYRGLMVLAGQLGLRLVPCRADAQGLDPDALDRLCAEISPRGLYCVPTYNPATTETIGPERRRAIAAVCRRRELVLIEDDAYGRLPAVPAAAIATWAPEQSYYVSTLSKAISPALRHGFIVAPSEDAAQRLMPALRHIAIMPSPLTSVLATDWIREGRAEELLEGVRAESRERTAIARRILPRARTAPECNHIWVDLPDACGNSALTNVLAPQKLSAVTAEKLTPLSRPPINGVRLSLGAWPKRLALEKALHSVADILQLVSAA